MKDTWKTGIPLQAWDANQQQRGAHFLQTGAWASFQQAQGKRLFYAEQKQWSWLAILEKNRFGTRLYCPYGPTAHTAAALEKALESLKACAKANGASYVRIEPTHPFPKETFHMLKLHKSPRNIQPQYTQTFDLTKTPDELLADMSQSVRRLWRKAEAKGFHFQESSDPKDIALFLPMIHSVAQRSQITVFDDSYYRLMLETLMPLGAAKLYSIWHENEPAATCITFENETTVYYAHAGTSEAKRSLQPGTPLIVHLLLKFQAEQKKVFDFYGIAPPDQPAHKLRSVTNFKQSFGGSVRSYSGTWELPVSLRYYPYLALRHVKR